MRGFSTPDSQASKNRKDLDVVHKLKKNKSTLVEEPMENFTFETDRDSEDTDDALYKNFHISPRKHTSIKLTFGETSTPNVTTNISNMDTNINSGEQPSTSILEKTKVTPPEFSHSESMKPQISL